jgi:HlyD family secretion protein
MRTRLLALLAFITQPAVAIGGGIVIAALIAGGAWYLTSVSPSGNYTTVATSTITQEVDVSGAVQGAQTTTLSFQISGQVASIPVKVGEHVYAGQVLVALAGGSQAASLAGAQANLEAAEANLASLQAGTRSQQLTIDQDAVTQDQSALADAIRSAYVAADSAVHTDADQLFSNPRTASAALIVTVPDSILANQVVQERIALEPVLNAWSAEISAPGFGSGDPSSDATSAVADLTQVNAFLDDLASALTQVQPTPSMPASELTAYEASIAGARTSIAGSLTALTGAESGLTTAEAALTLAQAGATPQAIAAGQAQVDAAQAAVEAAQVSSGETALVAPISGTVTAQNANPGEAVSPGLALVSLESDGAYEVKAPVSESDIAKVKVGQVVNATFDAYPGVTFPAAVTEVDPAATITNGVASYNVTATFTGNDPRIESGMTAHLAILTATVSGALTVPASAVIATNGTQFVYVHTTKGDVETPVTTGIENAAGTIQILSGLSAGQEVLTFGTAQ